MVCPKCEGSGRDMAALAVTVKVPNARHIKLMQPCCSVCGGTGEKLEEDETEPQIVIVDDPWRGPLTDEEKSSLSALYKAAFPCNEKTMNYEEG